MDSHTVTNQPPLIDNINLFSIDSVLKNIAGKQDISWANMIRSSSIENATLFCDSRLTDRSSYQFGMLKNVELVDQILAEYSF